MAVTRKEAGYRRQKKSAAASAGRAGIIRSSLTFRGSWRSYQARVLDRADSYMEDGRIHIVAAPGSGKTTLGIELIGRADAPCLILAPSITIREQWLARMREGFGAPEELLSNDIRRPAAVTAITYQALHSCLKRLKNTEEDGDGGQEETDYTRFDLYGALETAKIRTFCLDEAHHLRNEWQKALEEVIETVKNACGADCTIISLTATPPYDSAPQEWERYIGLCGPIDEEISVPELVKEGSLCPHQDYVYFNMPAPAEEEQVKKFRRLSQRAYQKLMADRKFEEAVLTHRGFWEPESCIGLFGERKDYPLSLLSFAKEAGAETAEELESLTGEAGVPPMDRRLLEILLQGFLFDDTESYDCDPDYVRYLADSLRAKGLIHKNRVELSASSAVDKLLINSRGKLLSIREIVRAEYGNLGEKLRLLVLTDFIRSEYLTAIGDESQEAEELGVVPIFESLRRACGAEEKQLRLAALSGSVVILPETAKEAFLRMAGENGQRAFLKECSAPGYYQAALSGTGPRLTFYLTELFSQGYIRVLIGTKSLLGEGWDSPCINSLILASFVGSFMLSNQMRGRAIRTMKDNPDKVSNIWHLICMEPVWTEKAAGQDIEAEKEGAAGEGAEADRKGAEAAGRPAEGKRKGAAVKNGRSLESCSADFATLRRRFDSFVGVNYEADRIESGLDRLSYIRPPYGNRELDRINERMTALSGDRAGLKEKWERILENLPDMETVEGVNVAQERLQPRSQQKKCRKKTNLSRAGTAAAALAGAVLAIGGHFLFGLAAAAVAAAGLFKTVSAQRKEAVFFRPELFLEAVGNGVLEALKELGAVTSGDVRVEAEEAADAGQGGGTSGAGGRARQKNGGRKTEGGAQTCFVCLKNADEREKNVFADTLAEFMGAIEDQRYLLRALEAREDERSFYPVPELFGKRKEDARIFTAHIAPCIGPCELIFTRSADGKRALVRAGMQDAAAGEERNCAVRCKKVQNR